jgi:ferric-dicitrate binding protein FerR (iron transport regulator)
MNPPLHIRELVFRYNWNELTPKDEKKLLRWRGQSADNERYFQHETSAEQRKAVAERAEAARVRNYPIIMNHLEKLKSRRRSIRLLPENIWWRRAAIAACTVVFLGLIYELLTLDIFPDPPNRRTVNQPLRASFIDAKGFSYALEDVRNGFNDGYRDAQAGRRREMKFPLFIAPPTDPKGSADRYNTLTTYDHHRYLLLLPDGSRTWQNTNSSVAYPGNYSADAPKLRVSGEAYIEMTPNKADRTPFLVEAGTVHIEAHTGRFNLRAYPGEADITITAIDGALAIRCDSIPGSNPISLSAGEQLIVRGRQAEIKKSVNIGEVLHWKMEF